MSVMGSNTKKIELNEYSIVFENGGINILKNGKLLYFNKRPLYASIKTVFGTTEFYNAGYESFKEIDGGIQAEGIVETPAGSVLNICDVYSVDRAAGVFITRIVKVIEDSDDLGFSTKLGFNFSESDNIRDYNYFAPAQWYRQNQFTKPYVMGYDLNAEYFWQRETHYPLPLFAAQNIKSGECIMLSRRYSDIKECRRDIVHSENTIDESITVGSIGISNPKKKTLDVLYYGFEVRNDIDTDPYGLSIDYVYPCVDGQMPRRGPGYNVDYMEQTKTMSRVYHPMSKGFSNEYNVCLNIGCYENYYSMMRNSFRLVYKRLKDPVFDADNKLLYENSMESLTKLTRQYGNSWGLPFAAQLSMVDTSSVSFQFGFVGQQPGIGYQLIRYGDKENKKESFDKGLNIIEFWVRFSLTDFGAPRSCYNPSLDEFEPMPVFIRMAADGLENILDAYVYLKKLGQEKPHWLEYLKKAAAWLVSVQNEDGSYYRAYNNEDGSVRMDSKANTISIVRFLIQLYLVTCDNAYKNAALKAGEWSYDNVYKNMEYRGSTCDNTDIMDNESGIYAMFGFLSLYDLTGGQKWLEALIGAADYTETWTYVWSYPVHCKFPNHPFSKNRVSGQSPVVIGGGGGGDMYMAACSYIYYRLYLITDDEHYRDLAEFLHQNTRQANDIDGSFGYKYKGLSHEGGGFGRQEFESHFHWLPWVTYIEMDTISRFLDTFGSYDVRGCEKLSIEERKRLNRIYENYAP